MEESGFFLKERITFRMGSRGCKRAAEAGVVAARVGEAARGGIGSFLKVSLAFRRSSKGCMRVAEAGVVAVRE
jgi:hypothetical protein